MVGTEKNMIKKTFCKVGMHKWNGCKCTRCGKERDKEHDFQQVEGECKQTCTICEKVEILPHQWSGNKCTYCGAKRSAFARLFSFLHIEKKDNKKLFGLVAFLIALFFFICIMAMLEKKHDDALILAESTTTESTTNESTTAESTTNESTIEESTTAESTTAESTTAESTTAESTTAESTTAESTTAESTTATFTTTTNSFSPDTSPVRQGHYVTHYGPRGGAICWCGKYMSSH